MLEWKNWTISTHLSLVSMLISIGPKNLRATETKASLGQAWNQSIVQQFTKEGNILTLVRKASPIGLKHRTIWKFLFTTSTKNWKSWAGEPSSPLLSYFSKGRTFSIISALSSVDIRLGTSEVLRRVLMSSTKLSIFIWLSVKRNTVG